MFDKMKKDELQEECRKRDIDCEGMDKKSMIQRLKGYEEMEAGGENFVEQETAAENETAGEDDASENQIRLQLIVAEKDRWKAEKEKMQMEIALLREKAQLGLLQTNVSVSGNELHNTSSSYSKLPVMHDSEDPVSYFRSFERVASLQCIAENSWAKILPSLLNAAMRLHYNRLSIEICTDYRQTKTALLHACRTNARSYLERFKTMHRSGKQTYAQLLDQMQDTFDYYLECKNVHDFESLKDDLVLERLRESLPPATRYFVEARKPKSASEVAEYADLHFECTLEGKRSSHADHVQGGQKVKFHSADKHERPPISFDKGPTWNKTNDSASTRHMQTRYGQPGQGARTEYGAQSYNHNNSRFHSQEHAHVKFVRPKTNLGKVMEYQKQFVIPTYVDGVLVDSLRDSGAELTLVNADVAKGKPSAITKTTKVQCAFGLVKCFSTCEIEIWSPKFGTDRKVKVEAGIVPGLPVSIILGSDIFVNFPELKDPVGTRQDTRRLTTDTDSYKENQLRRYRSTAQGGNKPPDRQRTE